MLVHSSNGIKMSTDQINKWKTEFGNNYTDRNYPSEDDIQQRMSLWYTILMHMSNKLPETILEVGAGTGQNIAALNNIYQSIARPVNFTAVEPNLKARETLKNVANTKIIEDNSFRIDAPNHHFDMVFTSGVLIHIHPKDIASALSEIYRVSKKYIVCVEYFSAQCREVEYRGNKDMLWTNDYGSLWLDSFPLRFVGCGFCWKRITKLDNLTWWIFEKVN